MEGNGYKTVYEGGIGEIEEKKSRFIATVRPVKTEEEAAAFIQEMKKTYWDARHNCSAYTIGRNQELTRCSDDGEPSGTAGRPMLDVLIKEGIHNAAAVVTRYFGGTLLGTGGLVRAYQKSVQAGLNACIIIEKQEGRCLKIGTDYNGIGKVQYLLGTEGISILDIQYTQEVEMSVVIPNADRDKIAEKLIDITGGKARLEWAEVVEFAMLGKQLKILSN